MSTAPLLTAVEADTALALPRVATSAVPVAVDPWTPLATETDTIPPPVRTASPAAVVGEVYPGDTAPGEAVILSPNLAVAPLPTAVEVDASDADVSGTTSYVTEPGTGLGLGSFGLSPFGGGEDATLVPITVSHTPLAVGRLATAAERNLALPLTSLVDEGEYGAAIEAIDRVPIYSLKADWNRNGLYDHVLSDLTDLVTEVQVGRALSGTLPVEVGLVEGYSSAELSVKLEGRWRKPPDSYIDRINLALNPSVEVDLTGYTAVTTNGLTNIVQRGNAITPPAGGFYLFLRPSTTGGTGTAFIRCPPVRVVPGTIYTFSAYNDVAGTLNSTYIGVDWMDGNGDQIPGVTVNGPQITGTGWQRGLVTATAPAGAVYARQFLVAGTIDNTNYPRWDAILVEAGNQLGDYFDGDTSGASWDGVAHASTSRILAESNADYEDSAFDLVDVFGPYRTDSPLYGRPVLNTPIYLETGFIAEDGPRLTRRFTGQVTRIHPQSGARTVELVAVDPVGRLRNTLTLSAVGMYASILRTRGPDAYRSRINSQWLIDYALRSNGFYTSPPPRDDAVLSVTGHGSMIPEIGWGGAPEEWYPTYRGDRWQVGPFGGALATVGGDIGRWWLIEPITSASGTGFGMSMWLNMYTPGEVVQELVAVNITIDETDFITFGIGADGRPYLGYKTFRPAEAESRAVPTGWAPLTSPRWKFVGVHVTYTAGAMTARFRLDGQTYTSTVNIPTRVGNWRPGAFISYNWRPSFQNFQMWNSATPPVTWQGEDPNWVPQADLDPGTNELTGVPSLLGQDSWQLIQQVTDAEGSRFEFTTEGRPQFRTTKGDELYGRVQRVNEVMTADRNLADLVSTTDETTIRNVINVKTKTLTISDWSDYFSATTVDQFDTPPGTSIFDIPITSDVYDVPETRDAYGVNVALNLLAHASFVFYNTDEAWNASKDVAAIKNYIRVGIVYADNPVQITDPGQVPVIYIRVERTSPTNLRIYITNYSNRTVRFATPSKADDNGVLNAGQPALIVPARVIGQGPEQIETYTDTGSVATYGASSFDVGGSDERWRQTPTGLRPLASEVLATTANPVPVLDAVDVPHDPRRALGQRVVLRDPQGLGEVIGSIVGLTNTYQSDGAADKVMVRPIAPPGLGTLDDPTHGLLDATLVLGP